MIESEFKPFAGSNRQTYKPDTRRIRTMQHIRQGTLRASKSEHNAMEDMTKGVEDRAYREKSRETSRMIQRKRKAAT